MAWNQKESADTLPRTLCFSRLFLDFLSLEPCRFHGVSNLCRAAGLCRLAGLYSTAEAVPEHGQSRVEGFFGVGFVHACALRDFPDHAARVQDVRVDLARAHLVEHVVEVEGVRIPAGGGVMGK